jgi:hypothetical protein
MNIRIQEFQPAAADQWDQFCEASHNATFLHTRKYLSYHGNRLKDVSLLLFSDGKLVGLLPAAVDPTDGLSVVSHPGITYGGLIHCGSVLGENMVDAFWKIVSYYREAGFHRFTYKAVPVCYHNPLVQDDLYALFRLRAVRNRCELSCAIDLQNRLPSSARRKRSLRRAIEAGVRMHEAENPINVMWPLLEDCLRRRHGARPVHTIGEMLELQRRFPANIQIMTCSLQDRVEAGVVLYVTRKVVHCQYIASSEIGNRVNALDFLLHHCIEWALLNRARYFDFGTSNQKEGLHLNSGLYQFKSEFGGLGVVHEYYELNLLSTR